MAGRLDSLRDSLRHPLSARFAAVALDLALIAALAVAAAYCTWVLLAPRAKAAPALGVEGRAVESASPAARRLFGAAHAPQAASGAVRLVGVIAPGRALFIENGRPQTRSASSWCARCMPTTWS